MAAVRKKNVGGQAFYYLEHAFRDGASVRKKEIYLGKEIPKNIEELKKKLMEEIKIEKWHGLLNKIKKNFSKEEGKTPGSAKEKELETFMIKFTYNTQRIEGSTLTLKETADLLEKGIAPAAKPIRDVKEAEAHKELFYEMIKEKKDLSLQLVLGWNRKLLLATKPDVAGKIRQHQVLISRSKFVPPSPAEVYPMLRDFFRWYDRNKSKVHPVELAALVHLKFVAVHPFSDGNGRISRVMINFVLNRRGYPMLNIPYEGRSSYYNALERAQVSGDENIFLQWFFKRYLKEHGRFLK